MITIPTSKFTYKLTPTEEKTVKDKGLVLTNTSLPGYVYKGLPYLETKEGLFCRENDQPKTS